MPARIVQVDDIPRTIAEAFHIASTGRPGPVLVDISKDALQAKTTFAWPPKYDLPGYRPVARPHNKQIREAAPPVPEQAIDSVKEDVQWAKTRTQSATK